MIVYDGFKNFKVITSTRDNGVSKGNYASLNLSDEVKDKEENIKKNKEIFFKATNIKEDKLIIISPINCPIYPIIYTRDINMSLGILHSDSLPIFFEARNKKVFGAIQLLSEHTIKDYLYKMVKQVMHDEKLNPKDMYFYIAPSLTFSHNIIKKSLAKKLAKTPIISGIKCTDGVYFLDEQLLAIKSLRKLKVPMENITQSPYCTYENDDLFFSKKRKTPTGKMISVITYKQ